MKKITVSTVPARPVKPHYVNNKEFYEAIVAHKAKCQENLEKGMEPPILSNYIGLCIQKIATKLANKPNFINYSFKEEMIDDGIENCLMYFKDFDPDKYQNPFAYFTQIIYYAFIRRIYKEERIRYTTYKFFHDTIITSLGTDTLYDHDDNHLMSAQMYDNLSQFMEKFENRERLKKEKRRDSKLLNKLYKEDDTNAPDEFVPIDIELLPEQDPIDASR